MAMISPLTVATIAGKSLAGANVVNSVIEGNDPSLLSLSALSAPLPIQEAISGVTPGEYIAARNNVGEIPSFNPNAKNYVVLEKYTDERYLSHGNLEDAWEQLKTGDLTFDSFLLAMVDIIDSLTLGMFRPKLLEIKINPHLKAREIVYSAEVLYENIDNSSQDKLPDGGTQKLGSVTQKKVSQITKMTFEISPESYEKAGLSFDSCLEAIKSRNFAEKTVVYARLDCLTDTDIINLSSNGEKNISIQSRRIQSVESKDDLIGTGERDIDRLVSNGGQLIDDREVRHSTLEIQSNTSSALSQDVNEEKMVTIAGEQVDDIDHLNGTKNTQSALAEQINTSTMVSTQDNSISKESLRQRTAQGNQDLLSLDNLGFDAYVDSGATPLTDKTYVQGTLLRHIQAPDGTSETIAVGKQQESIDHLAGTHDIQSELAEQISVSVKDSAQNQTMTKESLRQRKAQGNQDLLSLETPSFDEYVKSGANPLTDKTYIQGSVSRHELSSDGTSETITEGRQGEIVDHLAGTRDIQSVIAEQISASTHIASQNQTMTKDSLRQRSAQGNQDLLSLETASFDEYVKSGANPLSDKTYIEGSVSRHVQSLDGTSETITEGRQQETIDHLAGTRDIQSVMAEQINVSIQNSTANQTIIKESVRQREAQGNQDLLSLETASFDEYVKTGANPLTDKTYIQGSVSRREQSLDGTTEKITEGRQQGSIDHLAGTQDIRSAVVEEIESANNTQLASSVHGNQSWTRESYRIRESVGNNDILSLNNVSVDAHVASGASLLQDRERIQDTIVAVEFSETGDSVQFVENSKEKGWITEKEIQKKNIVSSETQTNKVAQRLSDYDHMNGTQSVLSSTVTQTDTIKTFVQEIEEVKKHHTLFGWNLKSFLGESTTTTNTPTLKTSSTTQTLDLTPEQDIFAAINQDPNTLLNNGATLSHHDSNSSIEHGLAQKSIDFDEGFISYAPFIGGTGNLVSKWSLGAPVTKGDFFWAALDTVDVAVTAFVVFSGGTGAPAAGGYVAAKTAAKTGAKAAAKATTKAVAKTTLKTTGKAVVSGTAHLAGKNAAKIATTGSIHHALESGLAKTATQTGKLGIKGGVAGAKSSASSVASSITKFKNLPQSNGKWLKTPGNSIWLPTPDAIPKKYNPMAKNMGQILRESGMEAGIPFKNGFPNFLKASKESVEIANFVKDREKNFAQADSVLAKMIRSGSKKVSPDTLSYLSKTGINPLDVTKGDIKQMRKALKMTWEERANMRNLDLVPRELHGNIPHRGGHSLIKEIMSAGIK